MGNLKNKRSENIDYILFAIAGFCFVLPIILDLSITIGICLGAVWFLIIVYLVLKGLLDKKSYDIEKIDEVRAEREKIIIQKQNKAPIILIATGILCFVVLIFFNDIIKNTIYIISLGTTYIILGLLFGLKYKRNKTKQMDERTKKMAVYAIVYSWYITAITIAGIYWVEYTANLSSVFNFDPSVYLALILIVMAVSAIILQQYLYRKPDINVW